MIYRNIFFFHSRLWKFSKVFCQGSICLPGLLESSKAPLLTGKGPGPIALPVFSKISPVAAAALEFLVPGAISMQFPSLLVKRASSLV